MLVERHASESHKLKVKCGVLQVGNLQMVDRIKREKKKATH